MENVKSIDSEKTLELIENEYKSGGINAVIQWLETIFPNETFVDLNQGVPNEKIYKVCNRAIYRLDKQGNVTNFVYLPKIEGIQNCNLIRIFSISYVAEPFQIELYGIDTDVEK